MSVAEKGHNRNFKRLGTGSKQPASGLRFEECISCIDKAEKGDKEKQEERPGEKVRPRFEPSNFEVAHYRRFFLSFIENRFTSVDISPRAARRFPFCAVVVASLLTFASWLPRTRWMLARYRAVTLSDNIRNVLQRERKGREGVGGSLLREILRLNLVKSSPSARTWKFLECLFRGTYRANYSFLTSTASSVLSFAADRTILRVLPRLMLFLALSESTFNAIDETRE